MHFLSVGIIVPPSPCSPPSSHLGSSEGVVEQRKQILMSFLLCDMLYMKPDLLELHVDLPRRAFTLQPTFSSVAHVADPVSELCLQQLRFEVAPLAIHTGSNTRVFDTIPNLLSDPLEVIVVIVVDSLEATVR